MIFEITSFIDKKVFTFSNKFISMSSSSFRLQFFNSLFQFSMSSIDGYTKYFLWYFISFSSSNTHFYESWIFCLFTFWVFVPDKSFKLTSKYTQKCQYNSVYWKENPLCNTLNWGNWFGICKIGYLVSWTRYMFNSFIFSQTSHWSMDPLQLKYFIVKYQRNVFQSPGFVMGQ